MKGFTCFLVVLVVVCLEGINGEYLTVNTKAGPLLGSCEDGFCSFLGISYGESTGGENRWKAPIPKAPWTTTKSALSYSPKCPQESGGYTSEDCLSLNIWVPSSVFNGNEPELLPCFVWIHGGAVVAGTGSDPTFIGDFLANSTGIIVVTINYRLGPLGFLNTPLVAGNFGLLDQQLAFSWVQDNIEYFGGDKERVTIGGQSAGGMSVTLHLVIANSTSLFSSAIIESNPAAVLYRTPDQNIPYAEKFAEKVNCTYLDMECLMNVPFQEIEKVTGKQSYVITFPVKSTEFLPWAPVVDGQLLSSQPLSLFSSGNYKKCPMMIGTVMNETNSVEIPIGNFAYNEMIQLIFTTNSSSVLSVYPDDRRNSIEQFQLLSCDYYFLCPSRKIAEISSKDGNIVYGYQFTHVPSDDYISKQESCADSVCHSAELPFVFHSQIYNNATWTNQEKVLSNEVMFYWSSFVSGRPLSSPPEIIEWPLFNGANNVTMLLNFPLNTTSNYRSYYCDFWDSMGYIY